MLPVHALLCVLIALALAAWWAWLAGFLPADVLF
jgi:hypothetical protein